MPTGGARPLRVLKAISHIRHIAFWEAVSFPAARRYPPAPPPSPLPHLLPSPQSQSFFWLKIIDRRTTATAAFIFALSRSLSVDVIAIWTDRRSWCRRGGHGCFFCAKERIRELATPSVNASS